jgi:hypothetical protein
VEDFSAMPLMSPANGGSATIAWTFPSPVFAFERIFWVLANRLNLTGNFDGTGNQTLLVNNSIGGTNGFLGVIGNANFSSIVFGNNTASPDAFQIDSAFLPLLPLFPSQFLNLVCITGLVFLGSGLVVRRLAKRR